MNGSTLPVPAAATLSVGREPAAMDPLRPGPGRLRLFLVLSGSARVASGGAEFVLGASSCLCLNPGDDAVLLSRDGFSARLLDFPPEAVSSALTLERIGSLRDGRAAAALSETERHDMTLLSPFLVRAPLGSARPLLLGGGAAVRLAEDLDALGAEAEGRYLPCRARAWLARALAALELSWTRGPEGGRYPAAAEGRGASDAQRLAAAVRRAVESGRGRVRIADLCSELGMNRDKIQKVCRAATGSSVAAYAASERLAFARRLLRDEGMTVEEAAAAAGFYDAAHLSRSYRKAFGAPPSRDPAGTGFPYK